MTVPSAGTNNSSVLGCISHDKVAFTGKSGVGKTTLYMWLKEGQFKEHVEPSHCGEYHKKWNTAGQELSMTLFDAAENNGPSPTVYFRQAKIVILVYDITNYDSFSSLSKKVDEAEDKVGIERPIFVLVGNKLDLEGERDVSTQDGKNFAYNKEIPEELVFEVSAKTGDGVKELFESVGKKIGNIQVIPKSSTPQGISCSKC